MGHDEQCAFDDVSLTRRSVLSGLAASSLVMVTGPAAAAKNTFIDVHHHFTAPNSRIAQGALDWSPQLAIDEMDRNGVAAGIGYLGAVPGTRIEEDRRQARQWNEFGAQLCRDHPRRFGLFASLPLQDVDGSLKEMAYAFDTLKADGLGVITNYGDRWLGDKHFQPLWEEANRRKAAIFVHPQDAPCCTPANLSYQTSPVNGSWLEWPMNTARTIFSLMLSQTLRKYPDIRWIFCHAGGTMPVLLARIKGFSGWPAVGPQVLKELFPDGIDAEFRKLHFECAQSYTDANIGMITKVASSTKIMFGTDYNRFPIAHSVKLFRDLKLKPSVASAIAYQNAARMFPRLQP